MSRETRRFVRLYYDDLQRDYPSVWFGPRRLGNHLRQLAERDKARYVGRRVRLPERLWLGVLDRFGHRCVYCGARGSLQQEHRLPVVLGGTATVDNIVPACPTCNQRKGTQHPDRWPIREGAIAG